MAAQALQAHSLPINPSRTPSRAQSLAAAILSDYSAPEVAEAIELLIDALDAAEGDPDLEDDDPCGMYDEDGINVGAGAIRWLGGSFSGPGCVWGDDDRNVNTAN